MFKFKIVRKKTFEKMQKALEINEHSQRSLDRCERDVIYLEGDLKYKDSIIEQQSNIIDDMQNKLDFQKLEITGLRQNLAIEKVSKNKLEEALIKAQMKIFLG